MGTVKAVSKKSGGRSAFTLTDAKQADGTDIWFNGDTFIAEKGDTIKFNVEVNGIWHNFSAVEILSKGGVAQQAGSPVQPAPHAQAPAPSNTTANIPEAGIAFIEIHGQKYKITLEKC